MDDKRINLTVRQDLIRQLHNKMIKQQKNKRLCFVKLCLTITATALCAIIALFQPFQHLSVENNALNIIVKNALLILPFVTALYFLQILISHFISWRISKTAFKLAQSTYKAHVSKIENGALSTTSTTHLTGQLTQRTSGHLTESNYE